MITPTQAAWDSTWRTMGASSAFLNTDSAGREALISSQLTAFNTSPGYKAGWWPLAVDLIGKLIKAVKKWIEDHFGSLSTFSFAGAFDSWCATELGSAYWLPEV